MINFGSSRNIIINSYKWKNDSFQNIVTKSDRTKKKVTKSDRLAAMLLNVKLRTLQQF